MITITSLTHPTMVAKLRQGLKLAALGKGHLMNGHDNRVYIQDRDGRNIIRLNWLKKDKTFIAYGSESRIITETIKQALKASNKHGN